MKIKQFRMFLYAVALLLGACAFVVSWKATFIAVFSGVCLVWAINIDDKETEAEAEET